MNLQTSDQEPLVMGFGDYTCNWGLHLCGLYETERERDEIIFGFFAQGVKDRDFNCYVPVEQTKEAFSRSFSHACPDCAAALLDPGVFGFLSARDLYYPDGTFSPWAMDDNISAIFTKTQEHGKRNLRTSAEMVWALEAIPGVNHLMAYESRLNYLIPGKPWVSVCMYNLNKFDGKTIMNVLQTHPFTINKGVITRNPYYRDPDMWLRDNAPEFLPGARR